MLNRRLMIIAFVGVFAATDARADELQGKVLSTIREARSGAFRFQRTMVIERTGSPRKVLVERYDPRRPGAERWSLVSVNGRAPSAKDSEQSRKARRGPVPSYAELAEWFGAPATRTDATPGYVTYRFARLPAGVFKIGSHDASAQTQAEASVNVKGKTPFVEQVRFTSTKGFKVMMVASVQSMNMIKRYIFLPTGAVVPEASASTMTGSLLGKPGQIKTAVTYGAFEAVK